MIFSEILFRISNCVIKRKEKKMKMKGG